MHTHQSAICCGVKPFSSLIRRIYDANDNLLTDTGKGITSIVYNHLNLPQTITKSGQTISYNYAADGTKLKANFGTGKVYDYVAGRAINPQLNGNTAAPTGVANTFYRYEYQINDHLGNLRVACRCGEKAGATTPKDAYAPVVAQENHYDPWGLGLPLNTDAEKVGGSRVDRFKFIGRESQQSTGWIDLQARFYDPQIGRFISVDPVTETQENLSVYQYGWNNPILRSDPNGQCPGCDDPFLIGKLIATAWFDAKHAIINTTSRALGSDVRAGYKVEDGKQVFETQISRQPVDNSLGGAVKETVNAVADVVLVSAIGSGLSNPGAILSKTSAETQVVKAGKEVVTDISRKANGSLTEPTLPPKTIASKDGVEIVHYTRSGDHGPPHLHVKGGGQETRIGQNGKPLRNNPSPSASQQSVIDESKSQIRSAIKKIGAWFNYNQQ